MKWINYYRIMKINIYKKEIVLCLSSSLSVLMFIIYIKLKLIILWDCSLLAKKHILIWRHLSRIYKKIIISLKLKCILKNSLQAIFIMIWFRIAKAMLIWYFLRCLLIKKIYRYNHVIKLCKIKFKIRMKRVKISNL